MIHIRHHVAVHNKQQTRQSQPCSKHGNRKRSRAANTAIAENNSSNFYGGHGSYIATRMPPPERRRKRRRRAPKRPIPIELVSYEYTRVTDDNGDDEPAKSPREAPMVELPFTTDNTLIVSIDNQLNDLAPGSRKVTFALPNRATKSVKDRLGERIDTCHSK